MRKTTILIIIAFLVLYPVIGSALTTNYRFTGQELDKELNLYNFNAREYNPSVGRFVQPDPVINNLTNPQKLKESTGQDLQKFLENPQALNSYSYTVNNPVKYVDPDGEFGLSFLGVAAVVFSGIFLSDIKTAQAPSPNSTPLVIESREFGDIVPVWKELPKSLRFGLGLIGGLKSFSGKITNKADDVVKLVHTSDNATDIIKNGFNKLRGLWVNNLSKSNPFVGEHTIMHAIYDTDRMMKGGDYGKFIFEVPKSIYDSLLQKGWIDVSKTFETYIKPEAMKIITEFLKK